jgi:hypothetical protein
MPRRFSALLIAVAISGVAAPAVAGPISGTLAGDPKLTPTGTSVIFAQSLSGAGVDPTYARFVVTPASTVDFNSPALTVSKGSFIESFDDSALFGTRSGDATAIGNGAATAMLDRVVTGAGLFTDNAGEPLADEMLMLTGPQSVSVSGTPTGVIAIIAEPSSAGLLAAATAIAAGVAVSRRGMRLAR